MGRGSYQASDWAKLKNSRGINDSSNVEQIFQKDHMEDRFDPKLVDYRESRDSEDSPESTPIIIGFDVTGSMGYLAAEIAKNSLNKTVTEIYDKQPVTNPHILCAPFTGPHTPAALQVTQFEADIRIVEQLLDMWVGFGGNQFSYDSLVWYFAAKHTKIDSFEKRGKKGFIFCIGDEICGGNKDILNSDMLKRIFGDNVLSGLSFNQIQKMVSEKYEIFHIVTTLRDNKALETWQENLPGRVANVSPEHVGYLAEVIISIMQFINGKGYDAVLGQWQGQAQTVVASALSTISCSPTKNGTEKGLMSKIRGFFGS